MIFFSQILKFLYKSEIFLKNAGNATGYKHPNEALNAARIIDYKTRRYSTHDLSSIKNTDGKHIE